MDRNLTYIFPMFLEMPRIQHTTLPVRYTDLISDRWVTPHPGKRNLLYQSRKTGALNLVLIPGLRDSLHTRFSPLPLQTLFLPAPFLVLRGGLSRTYIQTQCYLLVRWTLLIDTIDFLWAKFIFWATSPAPVGLQKKSQSYIRA